MEICQKVFSVISVHVCVRQGVRAIKKKKLIGFLHYLSYVLR